jgi:ElaB/YqjD/DUF883 family membrane-anchored ribosome-binding protein
MRIHQVVATFGMLTAFAAVARAQDTTEAKKPGGLNKVAHNVSKASKTAGRQAKEDVKSASSATHQTLKSAGNATKDVAKKATGYVPPDSGHKPGGLNKVARNVSKTGKKTSAQAKNAVKSSASETHETLKSTGNAAKDTLKKVKPPTA